MPPTSIFSAGSNAQGQLATGDTEDAHSFAPCTFLGCEPGALPPGTTRIADLACGANHTLLLLECICAQEDETKLELWGSGDGSKGQLGPGITSSTHIFQPLHLDLTALGLQDYSFARIAACWETSYVALCFSGRNDVLLSMGADDFGDLGIGGAKGKQVDCTAVHIIDLRKDPAIAEGTMSISSLTTGPHHILAHLTSLGDKGQRSEYVVGWGTSRHGQIGDWKDPVKGRPTPFISSPRPVSVPLQHNSGGLMISRAMAGTHHTVFLHPTGRVSSLGSNRKGQLTALDKLSDVSDIGCTWNGTYTVVRREDAWSVLSTGNHSKGQLGRRLPTGATQVHSLDTVHFPFSHDTHRLLKIMCGSEHVLAVFELFTDASQPSRTEVWGWGWNEHGNLGLGITEDQNLPVRIWPPPGLAQPQPRVLDVWAGCGTSWISLGN